MENDNLERWRLLLTQIAIFAIKCKPRRLYGICSLWHRYNDGHISQLCQATSQREIRSNSKRQNWKTWSSILLSNVMDSIWSSSSRNVFFIISSLICQCAMTPNSKRHERMMSKEWTNMIKFTLNHLCNISEALLDTQTSTPSWKMTTSNGDVYCWCDLRAI